MNIIKSFMLEDGLFRGNYIAADEVVQEIWEKHHYPNVLFPLFQEVVLLALALSAGIKYQGVFSLQIKGKGPINLIYADVTADKKVRGYITYDDSFRFTGQEKLQELVPNGQMIFSVAGLGQEPYQGIVAIRSDSLAEVAKDYFQMSEQIRTEILLKHQDNQVRCILLQKMPNKTDVPPEKEADLWETVCVLLNSVQNDELFSKNLTVDEVLFRLFHANQLKVNNPIIPVYECRCYRGKMENFLKKMTNAERCSLYNEEGEIKVSCQFCGETYVFKRENFGD